MKQFFYSLVLAIVFLPGTQTAFAQDTEENQKPKAEFSGFLRFDYWYDTYQNNEVLDGIFIFYPLPPSLDSNGEDINAAGSLGGVAMGTRLRTNITMPEIFNAKSSILVEVDFTGMSSMVHFRLRHALAKFVWDSGTELNLGQTWHPMFVPEVFPHVASLNTGAPFQSFYRSPQVTLKQQLGSNLKLILSAITQTDNKSLGPDGASTKYLKNNIVPNLHAQLMFVSKPVTAGVAIDYKGLMPRIFTSSPLIPAAKYVTKERIHSFSGMAYLKLQTGLLTTKIKGMYGQNLAEHLLLGGYAVSSVNPLTGHETYTPINHIFSHINITYGKTLMPGIFLGYAKNLGASDDVYNTTAMLYGRGLNIDYLYRITPNFTYRNNRFSLMGEVEYTFVSTGENDLNNKAKVINAKTSANTRFLIMIQYDF